LPGCKAQTGAFSFKHYLPATSPMVNIFIENVPQ